MATKKQTKTEVNKVDLGVFGYTGIESATINALSNNFVHVNELRRELQGKRICKSSIHEAMRVAKFSKFDHPLGIHSFYPDEGKCFVGEYGNEGPYSQVVISWKVKDPMAEAVEKLTEVLTKILKEK